MQWTTGKILRSSLLAAITAATLAGCFTQPAPKITTEAERVQQAFSDLSLGVALKDSVASVQLIPVHVGVVSFADGTKAPLWVSGPTAVGIRSRRFYVDTTKFGSAATFGQSACGGPTKLVTLTRFGAIVIGDVGTWPVPYVYLASDGLQTELPTTRIRNQAIAGQVHYYELSVTSGYFLIPSELSADPKAKFSIWLTNAAQKSVGNVGGLMAPGSALPFS